MSIDGKVIVLTGATRGIGLGLARFLADQGATLVVTGRKPERLASLEAELDERGTPYLARAVNIADADGMRSLVDEAAGRFGRIDGLVANAQTFRSVTPLEDVTASDMDLLLDTGPKGTLWAMQAVFPHMRDQGFGRIVTFGSNGAILGAAGYGPYVSSKEAIRGLTRVAAREWGKHGIVVNCVCPVSVAHRAPVGDDDPQRKAIFDAAFNDQPIARDGAVDTDIAPMVAFLLSDACAYMTGQTVMLDGGAIMRP